MAYYDVNGVLQQGDIQPYLAQRRREWDAAVKKKQSAAHRKKVIRTAVAGAALFGGAIAAPALFGGGAAAGGAAGSAAAVGGATLPAAATAGILPASTAGVATGAGMSIPWWSVAGKGVDTLFGIHANRTNSKANREALTYQERAHAEAMAFEREQMAESRRQFDAQQAAAKAALDASNKFEADKWAASEEERLYRRRLDDERETRRAPYRQASADALGRIPGILAGGRTSPGLRSLGSYRRAG